jgi:DNA-binding MarR family transcriptional regulator
MIVSAYPNSADFGDYDGGYPVLIAASSDEAKARAVVTAEAGGFRSIAFKIDEAIDRIAIQGAVSAIWVEIDEDAGQPLDDLLELVESEAAAGDRPVVISAPMLLVDPISARITDPSVELLVDASASDRVSALSLVTARRKMPHRLHDVSRDSGTVRLRQLSDEVSRIAATLARLSVGPSSPAIEKPASPKSDAPPVSLEMVRQVIRARRLRARYFDEELFADPAWDMLLDLLQAEIAQHRVPVSSLCIAAAVPATTALRWIKAMTDAGLFMRRADPHDGRRVFVELSPVASQAMRQYFREVGSAAAA